MTPAEVILFVEGYGKRRERELEATAWQTALVLSCLSGKRVDKDELLGRRGR